MTTSRASRSSRNGDSFLYLPVEIMAREFHAKVLLALFAVQKGWRVVLGHPGHLDRALAHLPPGVLLDKSISPARGLVHAAFRRRGGRCAAWCEEGLVVLNPEDYLVRRVGRQTLAGLDLFFPWGRAQLEMLTNIFPALAEKSEIAGNPRVDLLRPRLRALFDPEVSALRERHGDFVLINTNFALCNGARHKDAALRILKADGKVRTEDQEKFYLRWMRHKQAIFESFVELAAALSKAGVKTVVRPHPAESAAEWRRRLQGVDHAVVVRGGNVIPWLIACRTLVHNGCTTGIEAALIGRLAVSYEPVVSEEFDPPLPRSISVRSRSPEEVLQAVRNAETGGAPDVSAVLAAHVGCPDGKLSCEAILDRIEALRVSSRQTLIMPPRRAWEEAREAFILAKNHAGHLARLTYDPGESEDWEMRRENRLTLRALRQIIGRAPSAGLRQPSRVRRLLPGLFEIHA